MVNYIVSKFGGTSLATREQIEKVVDIVLDNPLRKFVVVSAPGKRYKGDSKITDLLIKARREKYSRENRYATDVINRFGEILPENSALVTTLGRELHERLEDFDAKNYSDSVDAFGEYASARVFTEIMKFRGVRARFSDPMDFGFIAKANGKSVQPDRDSYEHIGRALNAQIEQIAQIVVIPGFYASTKDDLLITLPRQGSDISGAVIANAINASLYENWTDEDGLRRADPTIIPDSKTIKEITAREAGELAYLGFKLQEDSLIPLYDKRIPLAVKNTNNPKASGTMIVHDRVVPDNEYIAGVACKKGYVSINISKIGMNKELGFGRKVLSILEEEEVSYEHSPTGRDNMCLIIEQSELKNGKSERIIERLTNNLGPLEATIGSSIALLVVAGLGMTKHPEIPGRVLYSLGKEGIYPRTLNMGQTELSLFVGVDENQSERAIKTIYSEFFK